MTNRLYWRNDTRFKGSNRCQRTHKQSLRNANERIQEQSSGGDRRGQRYRTRHGGDVCRGRHESGVERRRTACTGKDHTLIARYRRRCPRCGIRCFKARTSQATKLAQQTLHRYGAVHVLCNNAGVGNPGGFTSWTNTLNDWNWILGVNLMGVVHGIRTFLPVMIRQDTEAHIVSTASIAGLVPA
jgi:NAD(P)-dependent dehydrogenase (short-subunit alcohol dehydrogenase family)